MKMILEIVSSLLNLADKAVFIPGSIISFALKVKTNQEEIL